MDPIVTSSLISAGSNLLGGVLGGGQKRPRYRDALKAEMYSIDNRMKQSVESAKKYGVHPLVALGMQPASAPAGFVGGSSDVGSALAAAGQDVGRAVAAYQDKDQRAQTRTLQTLSVERAGLENELLRSQIAKERSQLAPAIASGSVSKHHQTMFADVKTPLGQAVGVHPMTKIAYDKNGNPIRVWNEEALGDSETMSAFIGATHSLPDWIHANVGKPMGKGLAKLIRRGRSSVRNP